ICSSMMLSIFNNLCLCYSYCKYNVVHCNLLSLPTRRSSDLEEPSSDYICNVHLMDYKAYRNADIALNEEDLNQFFEDNQLNDGRSEEHTSEFQSRLDIVFRLLLEIKKFISIRNFNI